MGHASLVQIQPRDAVGRDKQAKPLSVATISNIYMMKLGAEAPREVLESAAKVLLMHRPDLIVETSWRGN